MLAGVEHLHNNGFAHRDIKIENMLFDETTKTIKIIDFGLSDSHETDMEDIVGTLGNMAPELHLNIPYNGKSVDIFALAVVLFSIVVGQQPFLDTQPSSLVYKCLAVNKQSKFWAYHSKI